MGFKEVLTGILQPAQAQHHAMRGALDAGWSAQLAEDYTRALELFEQAETQAREVGDTASALMAQLHRSEVLVRQERYAEAATTAQRALDSAQGNTQRAFAYTTIGMIAQAQGDWAAARSAYERARDYAASAGSVAAEGRALGHLGDTYLHEGNASYAAHLLRKSLPKLNNAADLELSSYFTGLLGQALIQSGQDSEGQHLLERALRLAEKLGYRFYERYWAAQLGERALVEERASDAHTYFSRMLRLFKPETVSREYVRAVVHLSKASLSLRNTEEALAYAQIAVKTAEQIDDAELQRGAKGTLGVALRTIGRSDEAIPYLQAAADDSASVEVLRSLAAAQADSGDIDGAVATYQRAIEQASTPLESAQARRDLGLVYQRHGDFNAAINQWTAALAIYEEARAYSQVARLYCDVGSARKALGQRARAMKDYEQALMVLNSLNDGDQETRGLVLSNAANAYAEHGDAESADSFFTEAIAIAEQLGDKAAETTRCGNYGWFLLLVGRPRRAITLLERALLTSKSLGLSLQNAVQQDNLGLVYDALGDLPAALAAHRAALALADDSFWEAHVKVNLANTLIALREFEEARLLIDEALAEGVSRAHGELIIAARTALARWHVASGQPDAAGEAAAEAILLARKIDNRRLLAEALSVQSQQQAALGHAGESSAAWEEAQRLYTMLHMPQGKTQPAWLTASATRT